MRKVKGFFQPRGGAVVFSDEQSELLLAATEIHESIHAQLHHTTHLGNLHLHLLNYHDQFVTSPEHKNLLADVANAVMDSMRDVHETIATFCGTAFLVSENSRFLKYEDFLPEEYCLYLDPMRDFLFEQEFDELCVEGALNLGLLAFNSSILDEFATLTDSISAPYIEVVNRRGLRPSWRLARMIELLKESAITLSDLYPAQMLNQFRQMSIEVGVLFPQDQDTTQYAIDSFLGLVSSGLFRLSPDAAERYSKSVEFKEPAQFEDFLETIVTFARRDFGNEVAPSKNFEEYLEKLTTIVELPPPGPVLELRSEDMIGSRESDELKFLSDELTLVNLFPVAGENDISATSTLLNSVLAVTIRSYRELSAGTHSILVSCQSFDFNSSTWKGIQIPGPFFVIISQSSVESLWRIGVSLGQKRKNVTVSVVGFEEDYLRYFLLLRHDGDVFYTVLPVSEGTLQAMLAVCDELEFALVDGAELATKDHELLVPVLTHLSKTGWATDNQAQEDPKILISGTEALSYVECIELVKRDRENFSV